jgi:AbrB family looped-hinge helix DNA binding protein
MRTRISSKGQVVLPAELREQDRIAPGQQFEIERLKAGEYLLKKVAPPSIDLMEWLMACPAKDWFQPIESESTDAL